LGIREINLNKNTGNWGKMMSKNVKCGKISTKLGNEGIRTVLNFLMLSKAYILLSYGINIAEREYHLLSNKYPPFCRGPRIRGTSFFAFITSSSAPAFAL